MKKVLLFLQILLLPLFSFGLTYNVTVPTGTKACYIAGEMNGWSQQEMNKVDETHYTLDISTATTSQKYKYCSGPSWAYVENIAADRSYMANDVVTSWALIYDPSVEPLDVTYNVTVPEGTKVCYFAGSASNWQFQAMNKIDATHFSIVINTTTPNEYKYCSGPDWAYEELDGSGNAISNRNYASSDVVVQWKAVYVPSVTYNVTVPSDTKACYIAGEMNSWSQQEMTKINETSYSLTISGATTDMKYKYCSGPSWDYVELTSDGSEVANRSYAVSDIVEKWTSVWTPNTTVAQITNNLTLSSGTVTRYSFNSANIGNRTVDVWLPIDYTTNKKYAVLYMHDGQMLFDATKTWNGQEWKVDETISQLLFNGEIKDLIVVGIWNSNDRYSEYYPKKSMDYLPDDVKTQLMTNLGNDPKSDKYLNFIVTELKPYIDKTYSVNTNQSNTFIAGSSMGGLISWYALCEYPDVFGGAICMSTHWANNSTDSPEIPNSFRKYLLDKLPSSSNHKIYFDHGTEDLDANYGIHQVLVDTIMKFKGYDSTNWESLIFEGDGHNEVAWANRFNIPVKFILKRETVNYDETAIQNKINVLNSHIRYWFSGQYTTYNYQFKQLTPEEYQAQKPTDNLSFDAGFVDSNGIINISEPTTTEQKAVFTDLTKVALYYLCQSYMYNFYGTKYLHLLLKVGFGMFEAGLMPADATVKTAVNNYGGSLSSFDVMNNTTDFINNNGYYIAGAFGEFMNVYKNWAYQYINSTTSSGFSTDGGWFNTNTKEELLADFNRYLYARFLQPDENLRLKVCVETNHFKFYTNQKAASINFPFFSNVVEPAYAEYCTNYKVKAYEKLSFCTMIGCDDGEIEGLECDPNGRLTGGTAWSSGVHTTSSPSTDLLQYFYGQNRHELGHTFQGLMHQGLVTAWLNEGFPSFCSDGIISDVKLSSMKQTLSDCMTAAVNYFGHRPTYEETRIYPSPDYGYYTFGYLFIDYIYKRGGYDLIKAIQINDVAGYQSLGYASAQAFLNDFYFYFDVKVLNKDLVTLTSPVKENTITDPNITINWTPLKSDEKYTVSVSTDNKASWTTLLDKTTQTSCSWNAGSYTGAFYLKFSSPENLNLETVFGPFNITDLNKVILQTPVGNEYFIAGDTVSIKWSQTNVSNLKIEFTNNGGTSWTTLAPSVLSSANSYRWIVPNSISNQCKIKLSDVSNSSTNYASDNTFSILSSNTVGGPYLFDKNTVALLHFDNDLNNRSNLSSNAIGISDNITSDNSTSQQLGNCYKTSSSLTIPNSTNLSLSGDWTIETWVKFNSYSSGDMYLVQKPGDSNSYYCNYALSINPWWGNVVYGFYFSDENTRIGVTSPALNLNEWYHIAMTRDNTHKVIKLYIHDKNRQLYSTTEYYYSTSDTYLNNQNLNVGAGIDGYIDELRISNIVRDFTYTSLNSTKEEPFFSIYPNPSNGIIHLNFSKDITDELVKITNINGQVVYLQNIKYLKNNTISLSELNKGVYFIHISDKNSSWTEKIILK